MRNKAGLGIPAWLSVKDWLALNANELSWIVLIGCTVLLLGLFVS